MAASSRRLSALRRSPYSRKREPQSPRPAITLVGYAADRSWFAGSPPLYCAPHCGQGAEIIVRTFFTAIACFVFCFFVQFVSLLGGTIWAIAGGALTAALFLLLSKFFELNLRPPWTQFVLPVGASLAAVLVAFIARSISDPLEWWAPAAAGAVSCSWFVYQTTTRHRCALCNRRLGSSALAFECPRCSLVVCADACWDSEHLRCRLCEQNHVAILSAEPRWWDRQLGPRVSQGRCQ